MLSEDIDVFFGDFSKVAVWSPANGAAIQTGDVILDSADDSMAVGGIEALGRNTSIIYATGNFPGLDNGERITVGGVEYFVRGTPRTLDDGAFTQAWLGRYGTTN
ncbi:MAG: hypothetical protein AB7I42_25690 [Bradyrhizobium sp.]|uniref:head-tail joining protein n=1 Tax=Bradyrhizobium sp. TaxID=376 RepID=UPI003D09ED7C